jgi:anti-sigma factor RsiW
MRCDEVQPLQGAYLDSELDARTTLEIQQHLKSCAECADLFGEERELEACITAGLRQGERTGELWARIERSVAAAAADPRARVGQSQRIRERPGTPVFFAREGEKASSRVGEEGWSSFSGAPASSGLGLLAVFGERLRAGWRRSRWGWSGLAATWVVILVLDFTGRESETKPMAGPGVPSASEIRLARKQKEQIMAELSFSPEPEPATRPMGALPNPRSDRRSEILNT